VKRKTSRLSHLRVGTIAPSALMSNSNNTTIAHTSQDHSNITHSHNNINGGLDVGVISQYLDKIEQE
jgi:hypothetical protein